MKALVNERGGTVETAADIAAAVRQSKSGAIDAVVVDGDHVASSEARAFLRTMDARRIASVIVGGATASFEPGDGSLTDLAGADVSKEEIERRLTTLARFQSHLRRLEDELENMSRLTRRLGQHFREVDEEMRLASRLQHDFLPRGIERVGRLRFGTLYRPAAWVSGDIYDIQRLDETHVGFYIADAVGHGMAAGLLTMYLKRALVTKRIEGSNYEIVDPSEALQKLNDGLVQHALPNCQFVTACYAVINTETLVMRYARCGHPYPLVVSGDGQASELKSPGGLMGLFQGMDCPTYETHLQPGDKVFLYTDGIECPFDGEPPVEPHEFGGHRGVLASQAAHSAADAIAGLTQRLDGQKGSLMPDDDITVVVVEVDGG